MYRLPPRLLSQKTEAMPEEVRFLTTRVYRAPVVHYVSNGLLPLSLAREAVLLSPGIVGVKPGGATGRDVARRASGRGKKIDTSVRPCFKEGRGIEHAG